ncbi:hypothetical protein CEXT_527281 [Caerostris extrusa]|uniref:Uncharacterized protein n=1 Tax=Caerostris extrusa TaxID=172846 RepID=A0AAV4N229_CAEEX|nr:hypothetical protein CEXT_527281 [Caerostris extrusa]
MADEFAVEVLYLLCPKIDLLQEEAEVLAITNKWRQQRLIGDTGRNTWKEKDYEARIITPKFSEVNASSPEMEAFPAVEFLFLSHTSKNPFEPLLIKWILPPRKRNKWLFPKRKGRKRLSLLLILKVTTSLFEFNRKRSFPVQ